MKYDDIAINDNKAAHNFEMIVDGHRSFIDYMLKGDKIYLVHTEVPRELQGRGVAGALVEKTLQYIEEQHLRLVPLCTYVQGYLKQHPEWNRLVA